MLHEILFALLGKPGSLIIETLTGYIVNPDINYITEPEKELINKICTIGFFYA